MYPTTAVSSDKKDHLAQWAFDTRPILGRFHLWLEDVETVWFRGKPQADCPKDMSFVKGQIERQLALTAAVTALGTKLFGRYGEGVGLDKPGLNAVKKEADAVSAYAMSEGLWYLTRHLPENHAIMVCLGEGLMPKAGETPEMGANPQLGFGRVYARPEIARSLDRLVQRLLNDPTYGWADFYASLKEAGITVWGAAIDTLENTSRFALGRESGTMTILHVYDQPLQIVKPYEGYMGTLVLPRSVVRKAEDNSVLLDFRTPRRLVLDAIQQAYADLKPENIHVWTLGGSSRKSRIGELWRQWEELGCHLVEDGWKLPGGGAAFTESGTYSPLHSVRDWLDQDGTRHLFIVDGYAASAEAVQAGTLAPLLDLEASLAVFTSDFKQDYRQEQQIMRLRPESETFTSDLSEILRHPASAEEVSHYAAKIEEAKSAGLPLDRGGILRADDLFPEKVWNVLALGSYMGPEPYTDLPGVETLADDLYRVTVRLSSRSTDKKVHLTLRLMKGFQDSRTVFQPLLQRFLAGADHTQRPVKVSDSGRIRNELQTLCSEALEFPGEERMRVHFDRIPEAVIPARGVLRLKEVLAWYKARHPYWFRWLEFAEDSAKR